MAPMAPMALETAWGLVVELETMWIVELVLVLQSLEKMMVLVHLSVFIVILFCTL